MAFTFLLSLNVATISATIILFPVCISWLDGVAHTMYKIGAEVEEVVRVEYGGFRG